MVSSWLKDTCPAEAMEILSERVQIARCQARVVFAFASAGASRLLLLFLVCYMPLAVQNYRVRANTTQRASSRRFAGIREVIPQSTASSG